MGDFVKGDLEKYKNQYSAEIIKGIKLHRKVDEFTDTHRIFIISKKRIVYNKRFSGIIIDVCYDHFLAKHWARFSDESLDNFVSNTYTELQNYQNILPINLQKALPRMMAEDWLVSYRTPSGISLAFARISRRLKRENTLATAIDELMNNYSGIESDFLSFFPEIISYVKKICQETK
ncbi:acyl carrier protein phosphodiesterase [Microseira wollei]|uniref:Acyl carrier protein phosphodiesterase n=1 Tax=Microseira wollei NIES-4236 TaxID=2530354 RepID=A0AAV3X5I6_9CYAN|nr:acyl carrier protein phosphodiesterase [Microseira wollei]GET38102.1 protein of unknown function DUF479 [Microseira wollei NIES-4236]